MESHRKIQDRHACIHMYSYSKFAHLVDTHFQYELFGDVGIPDYLSIQWNSALTPPPLLYFPQNRPKGEVTGRG